ncbi:MAG: FecR family protein [Planctomycetota bacterium]|nr:FecR family protein [Planctomycetota bacterium]
MPSRVRPTDIPLTDGWVTTIIANPEVEKKEGQVVASLGKPKLQVQRRGTSKAEPVQVGEHIRPQDTLLTDSQTTAQIELMDGSLLVLGPGTRLNLTERVITSRGVRTLLTLYHGTIRVKTSKVAHAGGFSVRTTALMGRTLMPSSFVLKHEEPRQVGRRGCSRLVLIVGEMECWCLAHEESLVELKRPRDQKKCCDHDGAEPVGEQADEKDLDVLLSNIPYFDGDDPHPDEDIELHPPVVPGTPVAGSTPNVPSLPGVSVAPPRIVGDDPFYFTPRAPDALPPVSDLSP